MDPRRFRAVYQRLQLLDETSTYKIRPKRHSLHRATQEELEDRHRDLAEYTIALREILEEMMEAIAAKPTAGKDAG